MVVSSDRFNDSRIATVIVSAITSNLRGNVPDTAGLPRESVVNVSQTMVVDRLRLTERAGSLGLADIRRVDDGLRLVLGL